MAFDKNKAIVTKEKLTNIANAIRTINGTQDTYTLDEMVQAILNGGGGSPYSGIKIPMFSRETVVLTDFEKKQEE